MRPEEQAREIIDEKFDAGCWKVQDRENIDLSAARGVAEHIATSVVMEREDFECGWFATHGSLGRAYELFGEKLEEIMAELNERLVA